MDRLYHSLVRGPPDLINAFFLVPIAFVGENWAALDQNLHSIRSRILVSRHPPPRTACNIWNDMNGIKRPAHVVWSLLHDLPHWPARDGLGAS